MIRKSFWLLFIGIAIVIAMPTCVMADLNTKTTVQSTPIGILGSISVKSTPAGATIVLDGATKGTTPATLTGIVSGSHSLVLKKSGYNSYSTSVSVKAGKTTAVNVTLTQATGSLNVKSTPGNATVLLDGKNKGSTPVILTGIPVGSHSLILQKNGYNDYSTSVTITAGQQTTVSATLTPLTGSISVKSTPSGASILLDGTSKGTTPATLGGISLGSHSLVLKKTGYKNYSTSVNVKAGQTSSVTATLQKS